MIVKTITFGRVFNLGNYETKRIEFSAEISEKENPLEITEKLEKMINVYGYKAQYEAYKTALTKDLSDEERKAKQTWVDKYNDALAITEASLEIL